MRKTPEKEEELVDQLDELGYCHFNLGKTPEEKGTVREEIYINCIPASVAKIASHFFPNSGMVSLSVHL